MIEHNNDESINTNLTSPHCNQGKMIIDKKLSHDKQYESNKKYTYKYNSLQSTEWLF